MGIDEYQKQVGKEEGRKEEREKNSRFFVGNLLKNGGISMEKIADLAGVSLSFVKRIKKELQPK